jgi:single-strand DNA-binding protein
MNRVILVGNVGRDPELRHTEAGKAVLGLRLATNESYANAQGGRSERTEWHSVVVWGKRGEGLAKILSSGAQIAVEGRLETRSWDDKNGGGKRYATQVVATDVVLLGSNKRPDKASAEGSSRNTGVVPEKGDDSPSGETDDPIPF